jgi:hypothetical protein
VHLRPTVADKKLKSRTKYALLAAPVIQILDESLVHQADRCSGFARDVELTVASSKVVVVRRIRSSPSPADSTVTRSPACSPTSSSAATGMVIWFLVGSVVPSGADPPWYFSIDPCGLLAAENSAPPAR